MVNVIRNIFCCAVIISVMSVHPVLAQEGKLGQALKSEEPIKVYVKDAVNESGKDEVTAAGFKKALEESFANRRSVKFEVVQNAADSRIEVASVIKKFQYLERGPFMPSPGISSMVLDAAQTATANYVEMTVEFTVTGTKSGAILWKDSISPYVKKKMTQAQSIPKMYDKITRMFLAKCFGKGR